VLEKFDYMYIHLGTLNTKWQMDGKTEVVGNVKHRSRTELIWWVVA